MREGYGNLVCVSVSTLATSSFIFKSNMQYIWLLHDILKVSDRWISLKMFCSRDITTFFEQKSHQHCQVFTRLPTSSLSYGSSETSNTTQKPLTLLFSLVTCEVHVHLSEGRDIAHVLQAMRMRQWATCVSCSVCIRCIPALPYSIAHAHMPLS